MAKENNPVWRRFLAPALEILQKVRPPEGDFHPQGAWTHQYAVWITIGLSFTFVMFAWHGGQAGD